MEKLFKALRDDLEFREEFFAYAHEKEGHFAESFKVISENLNKQVQDTFVGFAQSKGMELQDSEIIKERMTDVCRKAAADLNQSMIEKCTMQNLWKK